MTNTVQNPISAIIVDDEMHARQSLRYALAKFPQINVVRECSQGIEAIKVVNELKPELMFLDIHMPRLDGFEVLDLLGEDTPLIVFVTAYDEHAVRAFDNNALDYLLKPLDPARLEKTIERVEQRLNSDTVNHISKVVKDNMLHKAPLLRILVRDGGEVHVIPTADIFYIEAADDYVAIQLANKTFIKQERLQNLESLLNPKSFCRIHRSYILNLDYLLSIESETKDTKIAILNNNIRLPISRSGYARLKTLL